MLKKDISKPVNELNIKNRTIFCEDNWQILRNINSNSVDLIYLDPPFNKKKIFVAPVGSKAEGASFDDIFQSKDVEQEQLYLLEHKHKNILTLIQAVKTISKGEYNWCYLTYMAVRLLECHRILKPTGSLYLHCDPTMSHYLKILLDCIFDEKNFRSEIVWRRKKGQGGTKSIVNSHDLIYCYTKANNFVFNQQFLPLDDEYIKNVYKFEDDLGRYRTYSLVANKIFHDGGLKYEYKGFNPQEGWLISREKLEEFDKENCILWPKTKNDLPKRKYYLSEEKDYPLTSVWTDINNIQNSREGTGYPTQKPLKLLKRIIEMSSNKNDIVLDPFCGSATTCVAAESLRRQWIGIDISPEACQLAKDRFNDPHQLQIDSDDWKIEGITQRTDMPVKSKIL